MYQNGETEIVFNSRVRKGTGVRIATAGCLWILEFSLSVKFLKFHLCLVRQSEEVFNK